jgi:hypothetical protein
MAVSNNRNVPWLMLVFSLPAKSASQRVEVWRKLQRYGVVALPSSGYVLPHSPANQERLEWLATTIRTYKGQASVVHVQTFDDLPDNTLRQQFVKARSRDYEVLTRELKKMLPLSKAARPLGRLNRLRRRLQEITTIDFFENPSRMRVEKLIAKIDEPEAAGKRRQSKSGAYLHRVWITRPRPGIDRVSSAWLIRRFIDAKARFIFGSDPSVHPDAIPFDMFVPAGFGHRGEDCTFETLCKQFAVRDAKVKRIAQIIHDTDLGDGKFGRSEGMGLDSVLTGWAQQDVSDDDLMQRGMQLIEGLYHGQK